MRIGMSALGLGPEDPCYDPNHPWYMPNFWNDSAECACIAANPDNYTWGQQCVDWSNPFKAVGQAIGYGPGAVLSGVASGAGQGAAAAGTGSVVALVGVLALGLFLFLRK